jgi:hypothetical protein
MKSGFIPGETAPDELLAGTERGDTAECYLNTNRPG